MRLPAYQIYNVLQQYTRRLNRSRRAEGNAGPAEAGEERGFPAAAAARRREIIGQVMEVIRENVARVRQAVPRGAKAQNGTPSDADRGAADEDGKFAPFVYNLIDKRHRKVTRTISVEAPGLLSRQLEERDDSRNASILRHSDSRS